MDIVIRRARPAEYPALGELTAQAYLGDGLLGFGESDEYLVEPRDAAKRAAAADVLIAVEATDDGTGDRDSDSRLLGTVTYVPAGGGPMADIARDGEAEIRMLAVAKEARGHGVGTSLVRACVDRARATDGCTGIALSTRRTMHSAHRVYERLGFTRDPARDRNPLPQPDGIRLLTRVLTL